MTIVNLSAAAAAGDDVQPSDKTPASALLNPTPTRNNQAQRLADFDTLTSALEYAADGITGYNFYDARGNLRSVVSYRTLRDNAKLSAQRLLALGLQRGDRVALIADTSPEFVDLFFACRYAGLIPFAMPIPVNLGSHGVYVRHLRGMLESGQASAALANPDFIKFLQEAVEGLDGLQWVGTPDELASLPVRDVVCEPGQPDETAYFQFTSGSTRAPRAVVITEKSLMSNLQGIVRSGLEMHPEDRCASWLPFYHDMGLVGLILAPMVAQLSVDYLSTHDFAVRPMQWLRLISRNRCTIAFGQPFGYKLCSLRARNADVESLDLSCWRAAGVGAELIRSETLKTFAEKFAPAGFNEKAFLPCYGLAEATLAISFAHIRDNFQSMRVDAQTLMDKGVALRIQADGRKYNEFVNCGRPLPGHTVKIVDDNEQILPDLRVGSVLAGGPSIMNGYFNNPEETRQALRPDKWLDTGDIGFMHDGDLYITGRRTDVIIINGRNIRAQDIEDMAEQQPEVRARETSAFSLVDDNDNPTVVLVIECRLNSVADRQSLITRLQRLVYEAFGVGCLVDLVSPHTLPRTSSGKLSRSAARLGFMQRSNLGDPLSVHSLDR
ncbi:MAG: fatty acyl-AMP ligase [Pseudomonadales bacterium]|nr:fatty acyl-AMP ligase [Pseudomonadales bacterium]